MFHTIIHDVFSTRRLTKAKLKTKVVPARVARKFFTGKPSDDARQPNNFHNHEHNHIEEMNSTEPYVLRNRILRSK